MQSERVLVPGMVSTIIPVFNRADMLRECVASVLAQTWSSWEIVIVDDGSKDGTMAVAQALASGNPGRIRVLSQANAGPGPARQAGLESASGEYIQFLDSDDLLAPAKFDLQVRALLADPQAGIAFSCSQMEDRRGRTYLFPTPDAPAPRSIFPAAIARRLWSTGAPLYRRVVCDAIGPWSRKRVLEDWDYDCRAGVLGVELCFQPAALVIKRRHAGEHAGRAWRVDPSAMQDRIHAYEQAVEYARLAGVAVDAPERQLLARTLFWMARNCDGYGLPCEARRLLQLASQQATSRRYEFQLYRLARMMLGGKLAARMGGHSASIPIADDN